MPKVKLKVGHNSGARKIYDRKPKLNEKNEPIQGEYVEVIHALSVEAFERKEVPALDKEGKEIIDTRFDPPKKKMRIAVEGKPFEVHDLQYVMQRHGSILEEVK